jgi:hypothetical protein
MTKFSEDIKNVESRLKIRDGFFDALEKEDDWSFIIKSHALIESLSAELLTEYFGTAGLIESFSKLPLGDKDFGKIVFLGHTDLLNKEERQFIAGLSKIRNDIVHNVRNTEFSFASYTAGLDTNQRANFIDHLGYAFQDETTKKVTGKGRVEILSKPKSAIWLGLKNIVLVMGIQIETIQSRRQTAEYRAEIDRLKNVIANLEK